MLRSLFLVLCATGCSTLAIAQNPALNMTELANWDVDTLPVVGGAMFQYNDVWGYTSCDGDEYALLGSEGAVHFIQVMPDNTLVERAFFKPGNVTLWRDMKTYHDRAFSMCDSCNEGLIMYDLSTLPDTVRVLEQNRETFGSAHNLFVDEPNHRLYVVGANDPGSDLLIYDLENIGDTLPDPVKLQLPGGYIHDINVVDNIAYASHGTAGLYTYDLSQIDTFQLLGQLEDYPQAGYNHSSWPSDDGNYLVMADETHNRSLKMVDISAPNDAQVTDLFRSKLLAPDDTATIVHNPFIRGDYIIASYYHDGVSIFDWTDPTDVRQVAYYDTEPDNTGYAGFTGNWGVYPFLPSQRILASDMHHGLFLLRADSITFTPSPLLTAAPALDTLGTTALCERDAVRFTATLPPNATLRWELDGQLLTAADTLTVNTAGTLVATVAQRHCTYAPEPVAISQTVFPDTLFIAGQDSLYCPGDSLILTAVGGTYAYRWRLDDELLADTTAAIDIALIGTYSLRLLQNGCTSDPATLTVDTFTVVVPPIDVVGDTLLATTGGVSYQWLLDGVPVPGATAATYRFPTVTAPVSYRVAVTDANGCTALSPPVELLVNTTTPTEHTFTVYPNPATSVVTLELPLAGQWRLFITDMLGRTHRVANVDPRGAVNVGFLATGSYRLVAEHLSSGTRLQTVLLKQ